MYIEPYLLLICILTLPIMMIIGNPLTRIFYISIVLYSLLSISTFNPMVDFDYVNNVYTKFFLTFVVSYLFLWMILVRNVKISTFGRLVVTEKYLIDRKSMRYFIFLIALFALLAFLFITIFYGVPLLNIASRYKVSGYFSYITFSLWIIAPLAYFYLDKNLLILYILLSIIIFILMGYRTPIVIMLLLIFVLNTTRKRFYINYKKIALLGIFVFLILAVYPLIRFEDFSVVESLAERLEIPVYMVWMLPFFLATTEGAEVITGIRDIIFYYGEQYGSFTANGMLTFLPGFDLHSRRQLSIWLGRSNWEESTTTSTLIGQFMIEFGEVGIYLLAIILSLFLISSEKLFYRTKHIFVISVYSISFLLVLLSIHTGLLDPVIIFAFGLYVLAALCAQYKVNKFN